MKPHPAPRLVTDDGVTYRIKAGKVLCRPELKNWRLVPKCLMRAS